MFGVSGDECFSAAFLSFLLSAVGLSSWVLDGKHLIRCLLLYQLTKFLVMSLDLNNLKLHN